MVYAHCIKATDAALVGIALYWVLSIALNFPDSRSGRAPPGALQGIQGHFFKTLFFDVF